MPLGSRQKNPLITGRQQCIVFAQRGCMHRLRTSLSLIALLLTFQFILMPGGQASNAQCASSYGSVSKSSTDLKAQFEWDMANIDSALAHLQLSSRNLVPVRYLGRGAWGTVYQVRLNGKDYALKLFGEFMSPHPTDRMIALYKNSKREGILIQKILGDLDISPKVIGILSTEEANWWTQKHRAWLHYKAMGQIPASPNSMGLLMELTDFRSTKTISQESLPLVRLSKEEKNQLSAQARHFERTLLDFHIVPVDLDHVITWDPVTGLPKLQLIDIGFYEYNPRSSYIGLAYNLLSYIETRPEKE
jgi:hypothetical protein